MTNSSSSLSSSSAQPAAPALHEPALDLVIQRTVPVPVELVWQAWTDPKHLVEWFTPRPWQTVECEIDLRPGGIFRTVMKSPEGELVDAGAGCYLVVQAPTRLVWTSALGPGFRPVPANGEDDLPFTADLTFEADGDATRYVARAIHGKREVADMHARMGFADGWGTALDQLVAHMAPASHDGP